MAFTGAQKEAVILDATMLSGAESGFEVSDTAFLTTPDIHVVDDPVRGSQERQLSLAEY